MNIKLLTQDKLTQNKLAQQINLKSKSLASISRESHCEKIPVKNKHAVFEAISSHIELVQNSGRLLLRRTADRNDPSGLSSQ